MTDESVMRFLYTIEQSAVLLSIGRTSVYALIEAGELERVKIGRRSLVPADSMVEYVRGLRAGGVATACWPAEMDQANETNTVHTTKGR